MWTVWLLSKRTSYNTDGTIAGEETTEYTSYTDETHYTYQRYPSGTTIPTNEYSRDGESSHNVYITRSANGDVDTAAYDYVYDTDSGLIKQESYTITDMTNGVTAPPYVSHEYFYTVTLLNTDADGKKTYKSSATITSVTVNYELYTIKDGITLSRLLYSGATGALLHNDTYTFPDNPVIRERLPKLTMFSTDYSDLVGSSNRHETCELLASTDTSLTVRIKEFYTSTNHLRLQVDYTYTKRTHPVGAAASRQ